MMQEVEKVEDNKEESKSNVIGCLLAHLNGRGFLFNEYRGLNSDDFSVAFRRLIEIMPVVNAPILKVYRARKVDIDKDVDKDKGIYWVNGKLTGGFNEENSRIPPKEACRIQRLNRDNEQVFYIAEDKDIAVKEQKVMKEEYLSIATFNIVSDIKVFDFSAYTHEECCKIITDDIETRFQQETGFSARQLYYEIQFFLTILDSREEYYKVSNKICDLLKQDKRVDGIRYRSFYNGNNLGIWKYRPKDYVFVESNIESGI